MRASRRKLVPGSILLACLMPFVCVCVCVRQFCKHTDTDFVGQRAPRHQKQLKAASICPLTPCVFFLSVSDAPVSFCLTLWNMCVPCTVLHVCLLSLAAVHNYSGDASLCSATVWPVLISLHLDCLNCLSSVKFLFTLPKWNAIRGSRQ